MEAGNDKHALFSMERLLDELDEIQRLRQRRRCRDRPSRLDRFQAEIVRLHVAGASLADICIWLARRRIYVARSTVRRALLRWQERTAQQRAAIDALRLDWPLSGPRVPGDDPPAP